MRRLLVVLAALLLASPVQAQEKSLAVARWHLLHTMPLFQVAPTNPAETLGGGGAAGASLTGSNVFTGANTFEDADLLIVDEGDATKKLAFSTGGMLTGNTAMVVLSGTTAAPALTLTDGTIRAGDTGGYSFSTTTTSKMSYSGGFLFNIAGTLKSHLDATGLTLSGGSQQSGLHWASVNNDPTGSPTAGVVADSDGVTLTESAATTVVLVSVASGAVVGGYVDYLVRADDGTDFQARFGRVFYQVVNKAGTETCVVSGTAGTVNPIETQDGSAPAVSAGTLTYTWGTSTAPTNGCNLTLTAVSSLVQTTLQIRPIFHYTGAGAPALTLQ